MAKVKPVEESDAQLCDSCGSLKMQDEEGKWYCPKCDTEIDWEGEDSEDV